VENMKKKTKKPPSRIRYEQSHPVVSARLDIDTSQKLKEILETDAKSFAQFLKEVIKKAHIKYNEAFQLGYNKGKQDWQIWYFCSICNDRIHIMPNRKSHQVLIKCMKENGWGHISCHKKRQDYYSDY